MTKWLARGGWTLLVLLIAAFIALASWEPFFAHRPSPPQAAGKYRAEIIRSEYGVPHIYGQRDADVAFGIAIAQSEDDFFTIQDFIAMARGRYGAIAGEDGAAIDYVYHLLDARGTARRSFATLPASTRELFDAYAAGLNQYAREHPEEVKLARLFPVNGEDIAAGYALRQPFFFGLNNVIQPLVEGAPLRREFGPDIPGFPRDASGAVIEANGAGKTAHFSPLGSDSALSGSNAFAVSAHKSGGPTTLISNSHQPLRGTVAWYELIVESGEGWHFAGANFPGLPYPVLGHNEHLGWTYTVNRPDLIDVYRLEMDDSGTRYRLDGEWRALESRRVWLPVRLGPITIPYPQTVHRSLHGPVIVNDKGAFAIRYAGHDHVRQTDAFFRLGKARSLEQWLDIYARMDITNFNAVYADREGNIAYLYNAAFPRRQEGHNWRGVLPGDDSSLIWHETVDFAELPKLINPSSGWLYNANNAPFTAAGAADDIDPQSVSPLLGVELKQTNRSRRAYKLLSAAGRLDRAALAKIKYDMAYEREGYVAELWDALEALDLSAEPELAEARDLLLAWDFTSDSEGRGDALALLMIKDFMSAEYQNKDLPDVTAQLRAKTGHLRRYFGRIDPPMSELLRLRQGDVDLPLRGGSDTLRAATTWRVEDDGRLSLVHGDSFIMWVEWPAPGSGEDAQPRSRSVQPFGAAISRPDSPHHTDQMELYVNHRLKPVHFRREDAIANASRRYVVESY